MTALKVLRYQRPMESVLTFSITQWYGNSTDQQRKLEYGFVLPASKSIDYDLKVRPENSGFYTQ